MQTHTQGPGLRSQKQTSQPRVCHENSVVHAHACRPDQPGGCPLCCAGQGRYRFSEGKSWSSAITEALYHSFHTYLPVSSREYIIAKTSLHGLWPWSCSSNLFAVVSKSGVKAALGHYSRCISGPRRIEVWSGCGSWVLGPEPAIRDRAVFLLGFPSAT